MTPTHPLAVAAAQGRALQSPYGGGLAPGFMAAYQRARLRALAAADQRWLDKNTALGVVECSRGFAIYGGHENRRARRAGWTMP